MSKIKVPSEGNLISFGVELSKVFVMRLKESFDRWDDAADKVERMHRLVDIENEFMGDVDVFVCAESVTANVINDICVGDRLQFRGDVGEWGMSLGAECVVTNLRGSDGEFTSQEVDFVFTDDEGKLWSGKLGMVDDRAIVKVRCVAGEAYVIPGYESSNGYEFSTLMQIEVIMERLAPGTLVRFVKSNGQDTDMENLKGEHVILSVQRDENGATVKAIFVTLGPDRVLLWTMTANGVTGHSLLKL